MSESGVSMTAKVAAEIIDSMIFSSGVLMGVSKEPNDVYMRQARSLAWHATAIALAAGRKTFLQWRYD